MDLKGFNVHGSVHRKNILIYVQQNAALHSIFYLETALHLVFVTPLLLPAAIAAGSINDVTNTRCCRYSCLRS